MKKIAVILGGCGTKDGSEINETVTLLLALDQHGVKYQCFAPDRDQYQVIDHLTGDVVNERRNMIVESARIVRGDILPLTEYNANDYDKNGKGGPTSLLLKKRHAVTFPEDFADPWNFDLRLQKGSQFKKGFAGENAA